MTPAENLEALGVCGILRQLARGGQLIDVRCEMPQERRRVRSSMSRNRLNLRWWPWDQGVRTQARRVWRLKVQGVSADNRVMPMDNTRDLVGALNKRAQDAAVSARKSDYRARALEAAFAQGGDERAWARIRLAADLRSDGDAEAALSVLDEAWLLGPAKEAECAMYTIAIAAHCDIGAHPTAEVIEREQAARAVDPKFACAAARLYSELAQATGDDAHRNRRDSYIAMIRQLDGRSSLTSGNDPPSIAANPDPSVGK